MSCKQLHKQLAPGFCRLKLKMVQFDRILMWLGHSDQPLFFGCLWRRSNRILGVPINTGAESLLIALGLLGPTDVILLLRHHNTPY